MNCCCPSGTMWRSGWITWQHRTLMHNFIMTIHTTSTYFHGRGGGGGGERRSRSSTVEDGQDLEGQWKLSWCMGGGGMRKLAWHFWSGTLCYRGESSHDWPPHITLILKMQPVMPTRSPMPLQVFSCPLTLQGRVLHVVSPASLAAWVTL